MRSHSRALARRPQGVIAAATLITALAFAALAASAGAQNQPMMGGQHMMGGPQMMQDQEMMHLGDRLRDCRGDAGAPIREEMMWHLRRQMESCSGAQCDRLRDRLHMHEQVQTCHMDQRACRELRMQERNMARPRHYYGMGRGMAPGTQGGMGQDGMGQGGMGMRGGSGN